MDAKAVGQRIKAAREKKSMTQEDLAARINISPTHVSVIERYEDSEDRYICCNCECA